MSGPVTFVLASRNRGKLEEMQAILGEHGIQVALQSDLGLDVDVAETGTTFLENAVLKATAVCQAAGLPAIADDSGLAVDALDGAPGVYSARYGGEACQTDQDRNRLLLTNLEGVPSAARTARFVCAMACAFPDGRILTAQGTCEGQILDHLQGEGGFGYDPLFLVPELGLTFAQLPPARKNQLSHRARALAALAAQLNEKQGEEHADE